MVGRLPRTLTVNGKEYNIRSDYRDCITILTAFTDRELSDEAKILVTVQIMYKEPIPRKDIMEAYNQAVWFLNCGDTIRKPQTSVPKFSWTQDEQLIFSAVNKVAGKEVRTLDYMHFWTFIGLFNEIGEGAFATVVSIRSKKQKNQKLEKWEKEFYRNNKDMIDLKTELTSKEKEEQNEVNKLLGI